MLLLFVLTYYTSLKIEHSIAKINTNLFSWNRFYEGIPKPGTTKVDVHDNTRIFSSDAYIYQSHFSDFIGKENGGAIYTSTAKIHLLIEETSIINVGAEKKGGGIYCFGILSIAFYKVCGSRCTINGENGESLFCFINTQRDDGKLIHFNDTSVINSKSETSEKIIALDNGKSIIKGLNSSQHMCTKLASFSCSLRVYLSEILCQVEYSSFANNTATSEGIIMFSIKGNGEGKFLSKYNNVLWNKMPEKESPGIIEVTHETIFENCCLLYNIGKYLFYQKEGNPATKLIGCVVDSASESRIELNIEKKPAVTFYNYLELYAADECVAKPDIYYTGNNLIKFNHRSRKISRFLGVIVTMARN